MGLQEVREGGRKVAFAASEYVHPVAVIRGRTVGVGSGRRLRVRWLAVVEIDRERVLAADIADPHLDRGIAVADGLDHVRVQGRDARGRDGPRQIRGGRLGIECIAVRVEDDGTTQRNVVHGVDDNSRVAAIECDVRGRGRAARGQKTYEREKGQEGTLHGNSGSACLRR